MVIVVGGDGSLLGAARDLAREQLRLVGDERVHRVVQIPLTSGARFLGSRCPLRPRLHRVAARDRR